MEDTYRCGDIIFYNCGYINGISQYNICKILDIVHEGKHVDNLLVITGWGEKNTKCDFKLKVIGKSVDSVWYMNNPVIEVEDGEILWMNKTHDICLINLKSFEDKRDRKVNILNDWIYFLKKNQNRIDKLDLLLEEEI
jgi:hypothetical protein